MYYILLVCDEVFSRIWVRILFLDTRYDTTIATTLIIRFLVFLNRKYFQLQTREQQLEEIS